MLNGQFRVLGRCLLLLIMLLRAAVYAEPLPLKPAPSGNTLSEIGITQLNNSRFRLPSTSERVSGFELAAEPGTCSTSDGGSSPWRRFPYVAAGTAVLWQYDERIQDWVQERRTPATDRIATYARKFGDLEFMIRPIAGLHFYGVLTGSERARRTARLASEGIMIGGIATQILKNSFNRPRPRQEPAEDPFGLPESYVSFPSGHSTVAFAVATVVASEYGDGNLVRPLMYGLASLTAWSRVNDNAHWASDVLFGSFVGYVSSKTVIRYEQLAEDCAQTPIAPAVRCPVSLNFAF